MTGAWWRGTRLVAGRATTENVRSKTFKIITGVLLLLSVAAVVVPQLLGQGPARHTLATVGQPDRQLVVVVDEAAAAAGVQVDYLARPDETAVRQAVQDGQADVGLAGRTLYTRTDLTGVFPALVSQSVVTLEISERLSRAGLTAEQVAQLRAVNPPEQVVVGGVADTGRAGAGFLVGIVLYLAVTFAGSSIAMAVAMEKSTRLSEVLLAVLRPSQVMAGTVMAVGVVTVGLLLILLVPLAVAVQLTDVIGLPPVAGVDLALALVWFTLGFLVYGFLFAAAGALVNKINEVRLTTTPITLVLIVGYMIGLFATVTDQEGPVSVTASLFPLTAPLVMPIRWAGGQVPVYQLVLAMGLTAAAAGLLTALAATVYRRALLVTGHRATLRDVLHFKA